MGEKTSIDITSHSQYIYYGVIEALHHGKMQEGVVAMQTMTSKSTHKGDFLLE